MTIAASQDRHAALTLCLRESCTRTARRSGKRGSPDHHAVPGRPRHPGIVRFPPSAPAGPVLSSPEEHPDALEAVRRAALFLAPRVQALRQQIEETPPGNPHSTAQLREGVDALERRRLQAVQQTLRRAGPAEAQEGRAAGRPGPDRHLHGPEAARTQVLAEPRAGLRARVDAQQRGAFGCLS